MWTPCGLHVDSGSQHALQMLPSAKVQSFEMWREILLAPRSLVAHGVQYSQ